MKAKTGCSAVRLAHLLWEQGVPGSNPGTPTKLKELTREVSALFLYPKPNAIVEMDQRKNMRDYKFKHKYCKV